jgi:Holliday junction resolvase RusA-like endonuclease
MIQNLIVPLRLEVGVIKKRTYYLNLNGFRNWNFQLSNQLKKLFKISVTSQIRALVPCTKPVEITFVIYYPSNRAFDLDNIGSVVCKFTNDALVELGVLIDDNYNFVKKVTYVFGGVDKLNPRVDVKIEEIE